MLIKDGDCFRLYPWKVRYRQHGQEIEQWALPSKEWWTDFADRWEHTEIIEFVEVELTEEQLERAEEIEDMPLDEGYRSMAIDYILHGVFPEGVTHPLRSLQIYKEQQRQDKDIADAFYEIIMMDLGG